MEGGCNLPWQNNYSMESVAGKSVILQNKMAPQKGIYSTMSLKLPAERGIIALSGCEGV